MKPFYHRVNTNFGDHINSWIWEELCPDLLAEDDGLRLIGIGSLISRNLDLLEGGKVILGTGSGYSTLPSREQAAAWHIYAVRGPLTARFLGLDPALAITDGAWLIDRIPRFKAKTGPEAPARRGIIFIPHWTSAQYGVWPAICAKAGITYVDPLADFETIHAAITGAELAICESLHGAIFSDYYRTPWVPVASPSRILKFKWLDWCQSLDLPYRPFLLPPSDYVDFLLQRQSPVISPATPQPIAVDPEQYDVVRSPPPPAKAGAAYRLKVRLRDLGRATRNQATAALRHARDSRPFQAWNARQAEALTSYLRAVAAEPPFLSAEAVRADRIARLGLALEAMRRDHHEKVIPQRAQTDGTRGRE